MHSNEYVQTKAANFAHVFFTIWWKCVLVGNIRARYALANFFHPKQFSLQKFSEMKVKISISAMPGSKFWLKFCKNSTRVRICEYSERNSPPWDFLIHDIHFVINFLQANNFRMNKTCWSQGNLWQNIKNCNIMMSYYGYMVTSYFQYISNINYSK